MNDEPNKKLLNETQAAEMVGLSVYTMRTRRGRKLTPIYFKVGSRVYYDLKDLQEFIQGGRVMPADQGKDDE